MKFSKKNKKKYIYIYIYILFSNSYKGSLILQPKLNDSLLEMFRNEYIGTDPYISCIPSLRHYRLTENDQFMVLSSDGLYQYLSNEEVVSLAMEKFPDGDPAQHVIQELLVRAAKKAGKIKKHISPFYD